MFPTVVKPEGGYVMKKYTGTLIVVILLVFACFVNIQAAYEKADITVIYQGTVLSFDPPPLIKDGYVFFPIEDLLAGIGVGHGWDADTFTVIGTLGGNTLEIPLRNLAYIVNGTRLTVPAFLLPFVDNYRTYVYLDYIVQGFDLDVDWNAETSTIILYEKVINVRRVYIEMDRTTHKTGVPVNFNVTVTPDNATDKNVVLSLDKPTAVLHGLNTITGRSSGAVTITATASNGVTGVRTVTFIDLEEYADEVFRLVNEERRSRGLPSFSASPALDRAAFTRADELIRVFSHDRPDGRSPFTALDENSVRYRAAGENIAAGQRTPAAVVADWMNSPGHRANILERSFNGLGVGVSMDNNGRLHWAQLFIGSN